MLIYILVFIIGLCVGSFLNVLVYREAEEAKTWLPSWLWGRSYCDHCKKQIKWYDNIPLLSFVLLQGKCRYCHKKISFQYPLVEFLTGIEFLWIYFLIDKNLDLFTGFEGFYSFLTLIIWLVLSSLMLAIFVADIRWQIIPDLAVFGAILATLFKIYIDYRYTGMIDLSLFTSAILAALFFLFLHLVTKGKGMGFGDIKLAFLLGLTLGFPKILVGLFTAFLTGAFGGVILIIIKNKSLKTKIAFGPFLIIGWLIALIWGEKIWQIYWQ